jgi:energy-converting hydrogenase Eha subunit C
LQGTAPSGQTADLLQLLVNSGLVFAIGAAGYLQLYQAAAPGNPPSGSVRLYLDSADGHVKIKKSSGTVIDLG